LYSFPEPFFEGSDVEAKRWSRDYRDRLIHGDITSLERVQDLGTLEMLVTRLPALVGSPLSINGLREDLQVAHKTVANWLDILERLYSVFRLPSRPVRRTGEVDFVVTEGKQLILMVEAKWNDSDVDRGLRYLKERFKTADAWQVSATGVKDYVTPKGIRVAPSIEPLKTLA